MNHVACLSSGVVSLFSFVIDYWGYNLGTLSILILCSDDNVLKGLKVCDFFFLHFKQCIQYLAYAGSDRVFVLNIVCFSKAKIWFNNCGLP